MSDLIAEVRAYLKPRPRAHGGLYLRALIDLVITLERELAEARAELSTERENHAISLRAIGAWQRVAESSRAKVEAAAGFFWEAKIVPTLANARDDASEDSAAARSRYQQERKG